MSAAISTAPKPPTGLLPTATNRIVAYVVDEVSEAALRSGLASMTGELLLRRGSVRHAIRFLERDTALRAIIVDIGGIEEPLAALEALSRVCPPDVMVVVLGDDQDIALYRMLVNEVGVAEYLPKPLTRDAVERLVLPRFAPERAPQPAMRGGHVVAVCGASGGAGSTTIAVSTAIELAQATKGSVALLDLNLQQGGAAVMLGAKPGPGLRIALEDPDQADTLLLERAAIEIAGGIRLIAADESLDLAITTTEAGVRQLLRLVQQKFNFIVIDMPMPMRPEVHQVLSLARQVVLVLEPDIISVRNARTIRLLANTMTGADRVFNILNRCDMPGGLKSAMVAKAMEGLVHLELPDLGKRMAEAVNLGIPAVGRVPALRKQLAPLIREIAGVNTGKRSGSWFRRVLGQ